MLFFLTLSLYTGIFRETASENYKIQNGVSSITAKPKFYGKSKLTYL